ncbi:MAG: chromate transporter [Spirochaetia bacterium]|uniref:chromate transporter n=1 Tax=Treponema sp. TaxID=166 RepID=UPI00298DF95E|nr:chromate transporter [Treponema sp.]MCI7398107.1 chromate transporter [Spirochaetia bacterium]MCI7577989.1 chromate transporter [Spirochaetia bacterium]
MTLLHLFFIFFYIGLFAVGGGLVAATFMQQELVEHYHLITAEKFYNMLAISESTPGPIGINIATYIGTELYGPLGGIVATMGEVLPSLFVIVIIAKFFSKFQEKPVVKSVFSVIRPATSGLVLIALIQVFTLALLKLDIWPQVNSYDTIGLLLNWPAMVCYLISLGILFRTKVHPVFIVLMCAVFGVFFL